MYHRKLHKYKEFEGDKNVIVGKGEVVWNDKQSAWIAPSGLLIQSKEEALRIATYLDALYKQNTIRIRSNQP